MEVIGFLELRSDPKFLLGQLAICGETVIERTLVDGHVLYFLNWFKSGLQPQPFYLIIRTISANAIGFEF